jgi:hypothetical protein
MAEGNGEKRTLDDLQTYPILTEEISIPSGAPAPSGAAAAPGTSALGQTATQAIRDILGWRPRGGDSKGFVAALNTAFTGKEVEGRTEWTWTPRNYAVQIQADLGAVTGAQASVYTRAKAAIDQALPLLDGLTPLIVDVPPEDQESVRAIVRGELNQLVAELGVVGGPRIQRVNEFFHLLLFSRGQSHEPEVLLRHPERVGGQLGELRDRFGLTADNVNTVDDEQNLTNFLIIVDYVTTLYATWTAQKKYFSRTPGVDVEPYFGTQLVLLSRALAVVAESVQEVNFALDSVFLGPAERQTILLTFSDHSSLFVAELLDWVDRVATVEGPALVQDGGKDGVTAFVPTLERLSTYVREAAEIAAGPVLRMPRADGPAAVPVPPPQPRPGRDEIPPGFHTPRVVRALQELQKQVEEATDYARPIQRAAAPSVSGVNPEAGTSNQSLTLFVAGSQFVRGARVALQPPGPHGTAYPLNQANVLSASLLAVEAVLPAVNQATKYRVVVTNPDRRSSTDAVYLLVQPPADSGRPGAPSPGFQPAGPPAVPEVQGVSSMRGSRQAGQNPVRLQLVGKNLGAIARARLTRSGETPLEGRLDPAPEAADSRYLEFVLTDKAAGLWNLQMTSGGGDFVDVPDGRSFEVVDQ